MLLLSFFSSTNYFTIYDGCTLRGSWIFFCFLVKPKINFFIFLWVWSCIGYFGPLIFLLRWKKKYKYFAFLMSSHCSMDLHFNIIVYEIKIWITNTLKSTKGRWKRNWVLARCCVGQDERNLKRSRAYTRSNFTVLKVVFSEGKMHFD